VRFERCERERQPKRVVYGYSAQGDKLEPVGRWLENTKRNYRKR
jgi:hypothetical protein